MIRDNVIPKIKIYMVQKTYSATYLASSGRNENCSFYSLQIHYFSNWIIEWGRRETHYLHKGEEAGIYIMANYEQLKHTQGNYRN
jgi:hypothetical protein